VTGLRQPPIARCEESCPQIVAGHQAGIDELAQRCFDDAPLRRSVSSCRPVPVRFCPHS
jgi:hypothetical protein